MLHGQSEVVPPIITQTIVSEDVHAHMDRPKQQIRQIRVSDMASLLAKFRMSEINKYTGIGYPRIHLRLYSIIMRAYGLDETKLIVLFPLSFSDSFPIDSKGKNPLGEHRQDVITISPTKQRTFKHHQLALHATKGYSPYPRYQYRQLVPHRPLSLLPQFLEPDLHRLALLLLEDITMLLSLGMIVDPMTAHSTHVVPPSTISIPSIDHDTESEHFILDEGSHGRY
ncbi:hypothetical protein AAG906_011092 [Vitis piasezkii]